MDEDRKIRFLVPPILFIASLFIGALADPTAREFVVGVLEKSDWSKSIGLIAGGGVVVIAAGYVTGTWNQFLLRLIFWCKAMLWGGSRFHEIALSDDSFGRVWDRVGAPGKPNRLQELSAGAVFDFGVLKKNRRAFHQWLLRRWNGFNTAANSISALVFSLLAGPSIGVSWRPAWCLLVVAFIGALVCVMVLAWRDTMNMAGFIASLKNTPKLGEEPTSSSGTG